MSLWRQSAGCAPLGANWFRLTEPAQRQVCLTCPVVQDCLDEGLSIVPWDRYETWGGVTFNGHLVTVYKCQCTNCGRVFFSKRASSSCSGHCKTAFHRKDYCPTVPVVYHRDEKPRAHCTVCDTVFTPNTTAIKACSPECSTEYRRLRVLDYERERKRWQDVS